MSNQEIPKTPLSVKGMKGFWNQFRWQRLCAYFLDDTHRLHRADQETPVKPSRLPLPPVPAYPPPSPPSKRETPILIISRSSDQLYAQTSSTPSPTSPVLELPLPPIPAYSPKQIFMQPSSIKRKHSLPPQKPVPKLPLIPTYSPNQVFMQQSSIKRKRSLPPQKPIPNSPLPSLPAWANDTPTVL